MSTRRPAKPEPNFARLVTDDELRRIAISAHALRRFVQRLQPEIPGAEQVAEAMATLEDLGSGNRSGPEQGQLNRYRDWIANHVQEHVINLIYAEGFWTIERPRWSRSDTRSDGYLQVGGICGFPAAVHGHEIVLTTCTNGRGTTWDTALARGYTLMPKPLTARAPALLRPPSWRALLARAWRSRAEHSGLLAALRAERSAAIEQTRRENDRRRAEHETARRQYEQQRDRAARAFRQRHTRTERSEHR
jgi:hypothetical protein